MDDEIKKGDGERERLGRIGRHVGMMNNRGPITDEKELVAREWWPKSRMSSKFQRDVAA